MSIVLIIVTMNYELPINYWPFLKRNCINERNFEGWNTCVLIVFKQLLSYESLHCDTTIQNIDSICVFVLKLIFFINYFSVVHDYVC
jgi:hypothetical protein